MEFKHLQAFAAVVKYNSFTKAAQYLFISQPTISSRIHQLEEELHTRLILRTTKSIEVTPKGQELYEHAVRILELRERMLRDCSVEREKIIHLGASTIPSAYVLPEILPEYGRQSPDTYFVIHQGDSREVMTGLLESVYELGLVGMPPDAEELEAVPFCRDRMVLITPVNQRYLAMKAQDPPPIRELLHEPIILREKGSGSKKSADRFLESAGILEEELHVTARINDQEAIKNLVAGGLGVSIISQRAAGNFLAAKRLLMFELPGAASARQLYLVYRRNYIMRSYVRDFMQFVVRYYAQREDAAGPGR